LRLISRPQDLHFIIVEFFMVNVADELPHWQVDGFEITFTPSGMRLSVEGLLRPYGEPRKNHAGAPLPLLECLLDHLGFPRTLSALWESPVGRNGS
jgi:hypothetical protein